MGSRKASFYPWVSPPVETDSTLTPAHTQVDSWVRLAMTFPASVVGISA